MRPLLLLIALGAASSASAQDAQAVFDRAMTYDAFLAKAQAQRPLWMERSGTARARQDVVARIKKRADHLAILVVAEDWCVDSANVIPYVADLARRASIPLRLIDRSAGDAIMQRHRTPDGRPATPTIVLLDHGRDVGAWVERPALLQQWLLSSLESPGAARRFADRQAWYDADRGRTSLSEIAAMIERATTR